MSADRSSLFRSACAAFALGLLATTACSQKSATSNDKAVTPSVYPAGVSALLNGPETPDVYGIFPGLGPDDCCWLQREAVLKLDKPANAHNVVLVFEVANAKPFMSGQQTLTVSLDGSHPVTKCCFGPGIHATSVPVPSNVSAAKKIVRIKIVSGITFVPASLGINADERTLGVRLRKVYYT